MISPYEKIISFLDAQDVPYQLVEHNPVFTSEQAASVRGFSLHEGAKSLLVKVDDRFILAIIPGDHLLDSKKLRDLLNIRKIRFATPEEVVQVMGCEIGACYPFGNLIDIRMYVDIALSKNEIIAFNPGAHDKSVLMEWNDYAAVVRPEVADLSK